MSPARSTGPAALLVGFSSVARMRENLRALAVDLSPGRIMKYDLGEEGA